MYVWVYECTIMYVLNILYEWKDGKVGEGWIKVNGMKER